MTKLVLLDLIYLISSKSAQNSAASVELASTDLGVSKYKRPSADPWAEICTIVEPASIYTTKLMNINESAPHVPGALVQHI